MHDFNDLYDEIFMSSAATTLTYQEKPFGTAYNIRDAVIHSANAAAADIYGKASPRDLIGTFLSETQTLPHRLNERMTWDLRNHGYDVPKTYFSIIVRPDDEEVGVIKTTQTVPMTVGGGSTSIQMTRLEVVKEWNAPRDLSSMDVDMGEIRERIGYTIQECQSPDILDKLLVTDNVRNMILDHRELLSSVGGKKFSWASETDVIKQLYKCGKCQNMWMGKVAQSAPQCSQCRSQPGRGKVYAGERRG